MGEVADGFRDGRRSDDKPRVAASELRIALAMSGGTALVLYQSGVAHEVYRFFKAWEALESGKQPGSSAPDYDEIVARTDRVAARQAAQESQPDGYLRAFRHIPIRPVLDILTGASAGGINTIFLGSCIATGQDFGTIHDTWIDIAGVEKLRYDPDTHPRGLLNNTPLYEAARDQLRSNVTAWKKRDENRRGTLPEEVPDLQVRLCRTHIKGRRLTTRDALGHPIEVATKADVIGFENRHFTSAADDQINKLAWAAIATSALPGVFAPVEDEGVWYADGGAWDNQPIDIAMQAVRDKPAFLQTHRCILFVEPNPDMTPGGSPGPASPAADREPEPSIPDNLLSAAFIGFKGNILPALQDILSYNHRYGTYQALMSNADALGFINDLGAQQMKKAADQLKAVAGWTRGDVTDWQRTKAGDALTWPSLLNQVRVEALLFDNDPALVQRWSALLGRLRCAWGPAPTTEEERQAATERASVAGRAAVLAALAALHALGPTDDMLSRWDPRKPTELDCQPYDLQTRALRRQVKEISGELARLNRFLASSDGDQPGSDPAAALKRARRRDIAAEKALLYAQIERLNRYLQDTTEDRPAYLEQLQAALENQISRRPGGAPGSPDAQKATLQKRRDAVAAQRTAEQDPTQYRLDALQGRSRFRSEILLDDAEKILGDEKKDGAQEEEAHRQILCLLGAWKTEIECMAQAALSLQRIKGLIPLTSEDLDAASPFHTIQAYVQRAEQEAGDAERVPSAPAEQDRLYDVGTLHRKLAEPATWLPWQVDPENATRYILATISDIIGRDPVDLVRISPNDTKNLSLISPWEPNARKTPAVRKLAGEEIGHLMGHLEAKWRRNDYIWGRLDACEILLDMLRRYGARSGLPRMSDEAYREEHEKALAEAQNAILRQEAALYKLWLADRAEQDALPPVREFGALPPGAAEEDQRKRQETNDRLIGFGRETLRDATEPNLTRNLEYAVQTAIRLAQGNSRQPPAALGALSRITRIVSYPLRWLAYFFSLTKREPAARNFWPLAGLVGVLILFSFLIGAGHLLTALYGIAAGLFLIALGGVLGWRLWKIVPLVYLSGLGAGYLLAGPSRHAAGLRLLVNANTEALRAALARALPQHIADSTVWVGALVLAGLLAALILTGVFWLARRIAEIGRRSARAQ